MKPILFSLALAVLAGCATVQPQSTATAEGRAAINARAERQTPTLVLRDGRRVTARSLRVAADSVTWLDPATGAGQSASAGEVAAVSFHTNRHVARNTALGVAAGAGLGFLIGSLNPAGPLSRTEMGAVLATGFGVAGAGAGVLTGVDRANRDVYQAVESPAR